jgi:hypothetical protein
VENEPLLRIQFEMSTERVSELDHLMRAAGIRTRRELFENALTLFEWAIAESGRGHLITALDEAAGRYRPILMPALETARRSSVSRAPRSRRARRPATARAKQRG